MKPSAVLQTDRLVLRRLTADDAPFMLELLNDPDFVRFVGDRGVRSVEDARRYLQERTIASYDAHGFGLYLVVRRDDGAQVGICGLVRRNGLDDVDIGFALLPTFRRLGIVREAAAAVVRHAWHDCGLQRLVAITDPDNRDSIRVLETLGFAFDRMVQLEGTDLRLFRLEAS
jgi:RimJ/RimL family protein N-acetyltransferase